MTPALRRFAALDHHVMLVGQGNKFELWDEGKWGEATARAVTASFFSSATTHGRPLTNPTRSGRQV